MTALQIFESTRPASRASQRLALRRWTGIGMWSPRSTKHACWCRTCCGIPERWNPPSSERSTRSAALQRPIVDRTVSLGEPWEVMFWLPFVKWARAASGRNRRRSRFPRSAPSSWYTGLAIHLWTSHDLMSAEEFGRRDDERQRETGSLKQSRISAFERELIVGRRHVRHSRRLRRLHPSILLNLSQEVWRGRRRVSRDDVRAVYERLPPFRGMCLVSRRTTWWRVSRSQSSFPAPAAVRVAGIGTRPPRQSTDAGRRARSTLEWGRLRSKMAGAAFASSSPKSDLDERRGFGRASIGRAQAAMGTLNGAVTWRRFSASRPCQPVRAE